MGKRELTAGKTVGLGALRAEVVHDDKVTVGIAKGSTRHGDVQVSLTAAEANALADILAELFTWND